MQRVTVDELSIDAMDLLRRVEHGERVIVYRDGTAVAELRPLPQTGVGAAELIDRRRRLPKVDVAEMRLQINDSIDPSF